MQKFLPTVLVVTPWYQKDQQWVRKVNTLASYSPLSFFLFLTNKQNYLQKLIKVKTKKDPVEKNKLIRFVKKKKHSGNCASGRSNQCVWVEVKLLHKTSNLYWQKSYRRRHLPCRPCAIITYKEKKGGVLSQYFTTCHFPLVKFPLHYHYPMQCY